MRYWLILLTFWFGTKGSAQELFVFSDLALAAGQGQLRPTCGDVERWEPYAALSPVIWPGGRLLFVLAVTGEPGQGFVLRTGQNPPETFEVATYRLWPGIDAAEEPVRVADDFRGRIGEGQRCALFVMEVRAKVGLEPGRVKVEPAVWFPETAVKEFWVRYPMEVRAVAAPGVAAVRCRFETSRLGEMLLRALEVWMDACPATLEWQRLGSFVAERRRITGKNQ